MALRPHANFPVSHPGAILAEAIEAMEVKKTDLADRLGVTRKALYDILAGTTGITAQMAVALEREVKATSIYGRYGRRQNAGRLLRRDVA
jgi:addiction module HigA family antidote